MQKNTGVGKCFRQFVVIALIITLLTVSTPATTPKMIAASVGEISQDIRFAFFSNQTILDFPNVFFGFFARANKPALNASAARIQIFPGSVTVQQGEKITFSAVGYDAENAPLSGIDFNWSFADTGRGFASRSLPEGKFDAKIPGTFTVTAQGGGHQAQAVITVTPNSAEELSQTNFEEKGAQTKSISSRESGKKSQKDEAKDGKSEPSDTRSNSNLIGEGGWNDNNWETSDNPGNLPGNPPGSPADGGAGSGNFQMSAPVISLPGRGIDLALNLNYNSRLWNKNDNQLTFDIDGGFPAPGWSLGFGKVLDMGNGGGSMLIDADGTRHGYGGQLHGINNTYTSFSGHTADGKFIDYYSARNPQTGIYSATAHFPNGTYISYGAKGGNAVYPTFIRDANGNYISITYKNNVGPAIETITDTLGRVITFEYDSLGRFISAQAPRMKDEDLIYGDDEKTRTLIKVHYKPLTLNYSFGAGITPVVGNSAPQVIDAIYYPGTNTGYWFNDADSYSSYGMITKVIEQRGMNWTATGEPQGSITAGQMTKQAIYNYPLTATNEAGRTNGIGLTDAPTYTKLTESWEGMDVNEPAVTEYAINNETFHWDGGSESPARSITITQPNGVVTSQYTYRTPGAWMDGLVFADETKVMKNSVLTIVSSSRVGWQEGHYNTPRPFAADIFDENGHKIRMEYDYTGGLFNQITRSCDYDNGGNRLRCAVAQYANNSNYIGSLDSSGVWQDGRHIFNLITASGIENPDGTKASWTQYEYDNYQTVPLADTPGVVQHEQSFNPYNTGTYTVCHMVCPNTCPVNPSPIGENLEEQPRCRCLEEQECNDYPIFDPATNYRGNVTKVTSYADAQNLTGLVYETKSYDITGNIVKASTACCEQTTIQFGADSQYAYPISQTRGAADINSPNRITTITVYNLETGLVKQTTDANGRTSTIMYNPNTLRSVKSISSTGAYSIFGYDDTEMTVTEEVKEANGSLAGKTVKYLNGLGQTKREESRSANNVWDIVEMKYTKYAEEWKTSRPYRTGETPQWAEKIYDIQGRLIEIIEPDNSRTKAFYNETTKPDSVSATLPGQTTRVADAWGRERWGRFDQQGRLIEVVEPNPDRTANPNGSILAAGSLPTKYKYDTIGRLIETEQGDQVRKFKYDDLGRMTRQKLAEQTATLNEAGQYVGTGNVNAKWSEAFWFDNRSNLTTKTDPRGVKTHFSYQIDGTDDPLNRLQARIYDLSGPIEPNLPIAAASSVSYEYMTTGDKSRIKKVRTAGILTEEYTYDAESRVSEHKQTIDARENYPMTTSYLYDTLDRVTDVLYPKQYGLNGTINDGPRKLIQNSFDAASRLMSLKVDNTEVVGNIIYNSSDQITLMKIGKTGVNQVTEEYAFDQQTGLLTNQKATKTGQTLLDLSYNYNRNNAVGSASGKTGHLTKIVNNLDNNKNREYEFDVLGRLTKAKGGNGGNLWAQNYMYDRYGNRTNVMATGVAADNSAMPADGTPSLTYHATSNRISTNGYEYDSAGNQTRTKAEDGTWLKFEYDAANRLQGIKKDDANSTLVQAFQYGSSNQRLMDYDPGTTQLKLFASGGAVEYIEYQGQIPMWTKTNIYIGDSHLSTVTPNGAGGETTEYNHPDSLGTRLVTNQQSGTSYEQTHLPFGKSLNAESSGITTKRFTSYERSSQTGLDYAVNRTYDSKQGRFTQVDPIKMKAVSLTAPQTLNLYSYCGNDPINHTDPSGLFWGFFKKLLKWVMVAIAVILAVMTIVAAPATFVGILGAISAGAGAASQVLNALGFRKAGMIFGLVAMITGFGSMIASKIGVGHLTESGSQDNLFGAWLGILNGVGAITNNLIKKKQQKETAQQRRDRIWVPIYDNALKRLLKKPNCVAAIKGSSSLDPATVLQAMRANNTILYGGAGNTNANGTINHGAVADTAGPQGEGSTIFLNDHFFDKSGSVGGWKARSTMNTTNARVMILLHELQHAVRGIGHPDTGNPTVDEADPESNTNWNKKIAKECFGVIFQ